MKQMCAKRFTTVHQKVATGFTFRGSNPGEYNRFFSYPKRADLLRDPSIQHVPGPFRGGKVPGREVNRCTPSNAKV
jgi:hypothetical protein